jgi:hypothetical protein
MQLYYGTSRAREQAQNANDCCPKCGYKLSNFRTNKRCFNCDYVERGSDGPWDGATDLSLIRLAETIWDSSAPFFVSDQEWHEFKYKDVFEYLNQRRVFDLASKCDQLRLAKGLHRVINIRAYGTILVGRIWHVRKGFVGVHVTRCEWTGGNPPYQRDQRRTVGACQGGAVWFGNVSPTTELVVGEGIETVLSAMILWGAKAGAATLGTAGLQSLVLPECVRRVVIAADNDAPAHDKAGKKLPDGLDAAKAARRNWLEVDPCRDVRIEMPPVVGTDWNDVLLEGCHG